MEKTLPNGNYGGSGSSRRKSSIHLMEGGEMSPLRIQQFQAQPYQIQDIKIIPQSRAFIWKGKHWGFVWNQPTAVVVEQQGERKTIPIFDSTLMLQIVLWTISILAWVVFLKTSSQKRGKE